MNINKPQTNKREKIKGKNRDKQLMENADSIASVLFFILESKAISDKAARKMIYNLLFNNN